MIVLIRPIKLLVGHPNAVVGWLRRDDVQVARRLLPGGKQDVGLVRVVERDGGNRRRAYRGRCVGDISYDRYVHFTL